MQCEMCGSQGNLVGALVEGVQMKLCSKCKKFGKVIGDLSSSMKIRENETRQVYKPIEEEIVEELISEFGKFMREEREKRKMNQRGFANLLSEKESIIHKIESGSFKPTIPTARKYERILKTRLVQEIETGSAIPESYSSKKGGSLTLGDLIKSKKGKNQK